jgi:hypothetical protein
VSPSHIFERDNRKVRVAGSTSATSPLVGEVGFPRFALRKSALEIRERGAPLGGGGQRRRSRLRRRARDPCAVADPARICVNRIAPEREGGTAPKARGGWGPCPRLDLRRCAFCARTRCWIDVTASFEARRWRGERLRMADGVWLPNSRKRWSVNGNHQPRHPESLPSDLIGRCSAKRSLEGRTGRVQVTAPSFPPLGTIRFLNAVTSREGVAAKRPGEGV